MKNFSLKMTVVFPVLCSFILLQTVPPVWASQTLLDGAPVQEIAGTVEPAPGYAAPAIQDASPIAAPDPYSLDDYPLAPADVEMTEIPETIETPSIAEEPAVTMETEPAEQEEDAAEQEAVLTDADDEPQAAYPSYYNIQSEINRIKGLIENETDPNTLAILTASLQGFETAYADGIRDVVYIMPEVVLVNTTTGLILKLGALDINLQNGITINLQIADGIFLVYSNGSFSIRQNNATVFSFSFNWSWLKLPSLSDFIK
jgi:hypothetical protein